MTKLPRLPAPPRPPKLGTLRVYRPRPIPTPRLSPPEDSGGRTWPEPPPGWRTTIAEWRMFWAHGPLGRGEHGILWFYQTPLFGSVAIAGFVPDFLETDLALSFDVHQETASTGAVQLLRQAVMASFGIRHLFVAERVALANPLAALREVLAGRSIGGE